jgi:dynamin 1-like protein
MNIIIVKQPPVVLKPTEHQSEQEALEIAITKLLLKSYYNIVRKNVEDFIPKAIMHFLVCNLYLSCIQKTGCLYLFCLC